MTLKFYSNRRRFLASAAACILARPTNALPSAPRCAIADISNDVSVNLMHADSRFKEYRDLGFEMLRTGVGWLEVERSAKRWELHPLKRRYLEMAVASGLKLKLELGVWSSVPGWFLDSHPDSRLKNDQHLEARNLLSPWFPSAFELLDEKQHLLVETLNKTGLLDGVGAIVASLGPAGEPIYPAGWMIGGDDKLRFWIGNANALLDFRATVMKRYHRDLSETNKAWGTSFRSWNEVIIPLVGSAPGRQWEDVLIWYRDSKRIFVAHLLNSLLGSLRDVAGNADFPVIILVPGSHLSASEWDDGIARGAGNAAIKAMIDTQYLIDLAKGTGAQLQSTATQNEREIKFILDEIRRRDVARVLWGENAGGKPALDPEHLADVLRRNELLGIDYINASSIFELDGYTAKPMRDRVYSAFNPLCGGGRTGGSSIVK